MGRSKTTDKLEVDPSKVAAAVGQLIAERGLSEVTVNNVSEKVGVSRATLYRTISDREQLFTIFFENVMEELADATHEAAASAPDGRERIRAVVRVSVVRSLEGRAHVSAFYATQAQPSFRYLALRERWESAWLAAVRGAMKAGVLPQGDVGIVTKACMAMCLTTGYWWGQPAGTDPDVVTNEIVNLICPATGDG